MWICSIKVPDRFELQTNYTLFAVLADVRNKGDDLPLPNYVRIPPILDENRGLPKDMEEDYDYYVLHSVSWFMLDETLEYFKTPRWVIKHGTVTREVYVKWDGIAEPESYSTGSSVDRGTHVFDLFDVSKINELTTTIPPSVSAKTVEVKAVPPQCTLINVKWTDDLCVSLAWFKDQVQELRDTYSNLRMTFGFDY